MVRVTSSGPVTPSMDAEPDTVTTSVGSGTSSLTSLIVTVPVLAVAFAAKRSSRFVLSSKSSSVAGATGLADTVTVKAVAEAGDTVADTVTAPASGSLRCSVTSSAPPLHRRRSAVGAAPRPIGGAPDRDRVVGVELQRLIAGGMVSDPDAVAPDRSARVDEPPLCPSVVGPVGQAGADRP